MASALTDAIIQRLRNAGLTVHDIRGRLPRNGSWMRRPVNVIQILANHHDAEPRPHAYDSVARYIAQANFHIRKDWGGGARGDGLMYFAKVDNVGDWFICRDVEDVLWSVGDKNYVTLSVCYDGTSGQGATREQITAMGKGLEVLSYHCPEFPAGQGNCLGHQEVPGNSTACPGDFLNATRDYRNHRNTFPERYAWDYPPPAPPAPPPPAPPAPPAPPPPTYEQKYNIKPEPDLRTLFVQADGVVLRNFDDDGKMPTSPTYTKNHSVEVVAQAEYQGRKYYLTRFALGNKRAYGFRQGELGNKVEPPPPPTPPSPPPESAERKFLTDIRARIDNRLKEIP